MKEHIKTTTYLLSSLFVLSFSERETLKNLVAVHQMTRKCFLLVLLVALQVLFKWPYVDAVSPRRHTSASQSTFSELEALPEAAPILHGEPISAAFFDAISREERERAGEQTTLPVKHVVIAPNSAIEQESAQIISAGDVADSTGNVKGKRKAKTTTTDGESRKLTRKRKRKGKMVLNTEIAAGREEDDQTAPLFPIPALGKETLEENQAKGSKLTPFYVLDVPPTKAGKLYQEMEKKYWEIKEEGILDLGSSSRTVFFRTKDLGLTEEERNEFRGYVSQFFNRLHAKDPRHRQHKEKYRLKRYGPSNWAMKTDEQKRETRLKARRTYLMSRLNMCLAAGNRKAWTEKHDRMLQAYVAELPRLEEGDLLLELYKDVVAANEGMERCIQLPA